MREDGPSLTARGVAAYRLGFERLAVPFGDRASDERLARDVVGSLEFPRSEPLARYLDGRTRFFDWIVIDGLDRGVTQVAVIAAGYDGRSLRYAKPGTRWFEVDHPATQADKRGRLERLGIDVGHVGFIALDLTDGGVDTALAESGWDPAAASLILCEGLTVYLDPQVLQTLLDDLRAISSAQTQLAVSFGVQVTEADQLARRRLLYAAIAALGEPARNAVTAEDAEPMLAGAGWRAVEVSEPARRAGFVLAGPA